MPTSRTDRGVPHPGPVAWSALLMAVLALLLVGCGAADSSPAPGYAAARTRIDEVIAASERWAGASTLAQARAAAEEVANLITGPGVTEYGDADRDGTVAGAREVGLLPGDNGGPSLALTLADCAGRPLLGGSWSDARQRWDDLRRRISAWREDDNTFPPLASETLRVVGWARLALATDSLAKALEYSGHARLHVRAAAAAIEECS